MLDAVDTRRPPLRPPGLRAHRERAHTARDWREFEPLIGHAGSAVLRGPFARIRRLKPAQIADLIEDASKGQPGGGAGKPAGSSAVPDEAHLGDIEGALGRVHVNEQSDQERTLRRRLLTFLAVMGPGIIVMVGDNEAGGVAVYSQAGQNYGYTLLWTLLLLSPPEHGKRPGGRRGFTIGC